MSGERRRRRRARRGTPRASAPRPRSGAGRVARRRAAIALGALLAAAAFWGAWKSARRPAPAPDPRAGVPSPAAAGSLDAASRRKDWVGALAWARLLTAREPHNSALVLRLALAEHNLALGGEHDARTRSATRTSLDRIRAEQQTFALLDSAAALALNADEAARVHHWRGAALETLGLPIDALMEYEAALGTEPGLAISLQRGRSVRAWLSDPSIPATPQASAP